MKIIKKLNARIDLANSLLCIGLDSAIQRLPEQFLKDETPQFAFNRWIIDQTHPYVCAFKPNTAFYEARGAQGWHELTLTINYIRQNYPDIVTICDAKRGDIGSTNTGYVQAVFDEMGFDAITLHPYLGQEALQPFLERDDKACIILCRTSNKGANEFQDVLIDSIPMWQYVAQQVATQWNTAGNCMLVVGATAPSQLGGVRNIVRNMPILVPGIGTQGGDLFAVIKAGLDKDNRGLLINSSRNIIFSNNPANSAQQLLNEINKHREN